MRWSLLVLVLLPVLIVAEDAVPFRRVDLPATSSAYDGFAAMVLRSASEVDRFLEPSDQRRNIARDPHMRARLAAAGAATDFASEVLVLLPITLPTGGYKVVWEEPTLVDRELQCAAMVTPPPPDVFVALSVVYFCFAIRIDRRRVDAVVWNGGNDQLRLVIADDAP